LTAKIARLMRAGNVDVIFATTRHNVRYLTGGVVTPAGYEGLGDIERDWCTVPDG